MKKHKSVVAILLSVMMIFTMMPMMAFAAAAPNWADGYKTVSYDGHTFQTEHAFGATTALTTVTAQPIPESSIGASDGVAVPPAVGNKYYFDLTNATLVYQAGTEWKALDGTKWANKAALDNASIGIAVVEQPGMKDYEQHVKDNNGKPVVAVKQFGAFGSYWNVTKKVEGYSEDKVSQDQPVTISAEIKCTADGESTITGDEGFEDLWGSIAPATVTVVGKKMTVEDAGFYFDTVGNGEAVNDGGALCTWYDGSAHTVVADTVEGWTVSYAVFGTNGKYEATSAVSITDVLETEMKVRATFKDNAGKEADVNKFFTVNLAAPCEVVSGDYVIPAARITWSEELSVTDAPNLTFTVPGAEYNTADYVAIYPNTYDVPAGDKEGKAFMAAVEKAVKANEALIKEFFNDFYEITEKNTKAAPDKYTIRLVSKDLSGLSEAEMKALTDKYAQMVLNIGAPDAYGSATLLINTDAVKDVEVEFTKAITSKTYKGKKAIKKGKLKKNQTITVKAEANSGAPVYYKLVGVDTSKIKIDKTTGKITLKKGLKKGTYKIKVKAYVPFSIYERNDFFEYQTIKVKVNKK